MGEALKGKVAIITGAGQGVGWGIARRFARDGATLMLAQRNADQGSQAAKALHDEFGCETAFLKTDVCHRDQVDALIGSTVERFGAVDVLVNNAGGSFPKRLEKHTDEDMRQGMDLNFWSAFYAMRAAFPHMKAKGWGRVINLGSLNGVNAHLFTAQYNVGKEAVRALTRTAAVEWAEFGINCNIICPATTSPATEVYQRDFPEMMEGMLKQIPRRRLGNPEKDVGGVAAFLASEDSAHITGMTFFVDGGSHVNGVSWRPEVDD
jgi:NAD(P)-dependent dehydrogenase (short-subunit alcohol dehydrogenase family)